MADEKPQTIKEQLLHEAAVILEQEGWLLSIALREISSRRLRNFNERHTEWQKSVNAARAEGQYMWPQPPDNS